MAGATAEEAAAAFLEQIRATLGCITVATAYASSPASGQTRSVTLHAVGQHELGRIRLFTHGGHGELVLRFALSFATEQRRASERGLFQFSNASYHCRILDYRENEIAVSHWHPLGKSSVKTPHLHVSAAGSIVLQQRFGSRLADRTTHHGRIHFPTQQVVLEDIVELLIRDFLVDPLRPDWEAVLRANRVADELDHGSLNLL